MLYRHPWKIRHPDVIDAREKAHRAFDRLWKEGFMTKEQAYKWLAVKMKLPENEAHIGRMCIEQCNAVAVHATNKYTAMKHEKAPCLSE